MRHLALVVLVVLWIAVAPAQAETKTAPDGFGPIKVGMSKEEAWAAIGGEGEWTQTNELNYTLELPNWTPAKSEVSVTQQFSNGRATLASVALLRHHEYDVECLTTLSGVLSYITNRYGTQPIHTQARSESVTMKSLDFYHFTYPNWSAIVVVFGQRQPISDKKKILCNIDLYYDPTGDIGDVNAIPF